MKRILRTLATLVLLLLLLAIGFRLRYGGQVVAFPDRTTPPLLAQPQLEVVATLEEAPGNLAVSESGRVFFSLHPEGRPPGNKVVELVNGQPVPYPNLEMQSARGGGKPYFDTVLGVRIDQKNRLWTIDHGFHGLRTPRLLAFDLRNAELVHEYAFPSSVAGLGSFLQDFQVDPEGRYIYIADVGVLAKKPGLIVYDSVERKAFRRLDRHASVTDKPYQINARGKVMILLGGLFALHAAVDSIGLDQKGEWLYYGAMAHEDLFRVRTAELRDLSLPEGELEKHVELFGPKVQSDGISVDNEGNVYLTDVEHGGIALLDQKRKLKTLFLDPRIRWADGLSFAPGGFLYISDSDIPDLMTKTRNHIRKNAPYFIFRVQTGHAGTPGR